MSTRGDTTNTNLQNMEPVPETDEEQVPEDLGKLTVVDKARTGRVSLKKKGLTSNSVKLCIPVFTPKRKCLWPLFTELLLVLQHRLTWPHKAHKGVLTPNKQEPSVFALCYTTISKTAVLFAARFCAFTV